MDFDSDQSLKEWAKDKPLSILQLDPADRAVLKIADERDAIQKKTFTKWVNKHLKKTYTCLHVCVDSGSGICCPHVANRHVNDLFLDLQDGHNLISLLEVLSGEHLPRERGKMRFHMLQNVQMALDFLRYKKIKLVNIRAEDIVDGNPKLTLGLIWTIILHFQISDIVVGQEPNVSAKDVLLRWARRSTAKYPGVKVSDFTQSWRDGLAFNALIHRNRPDLIDWRNIRSRQIRDRLENAFHVAEREYGVTRLLDPEDVDTHEIDEKSIITYISSLYDVFPEPPAMHPLYDSESQSRVSEYRELASSLVLWMREKTAIMSDRHFPPTLIEIKKLVAESNRFRTEEIPSRQRDKTRLQNTFRDLQRYFESVGEVDVEPELHIDNIERNWNRLMMAHSERDHALQDELKRLERLQKLAEKVHREMKRVDTRLEDLESRVNEEARRLDRLHPLDAKRNGDVLEEELRATEENIQTLFNDVTTLREGHYPQASDLHKRVQKLHQRWVSLRSLLQSKLIQPLASLSFPVVEERTVTRQTRTVLETRLVDTNIHFRQLHDCLDWVKSKLKQLQEAEFGSDLPGVEAELDLHKREHKTIEQFHTRVEHCINAKNNFHGDELSLYVQHLNLLQKNYSELVSTSNRRLTDLETLHDFLQSATNQLVWLNEREETEITRDWSSRDINIPALEQYYESLMSELEKREIGLSSVQDRGEALLLQQHPAAKCIEAFIAAIQAQWAWLLQLVLCLETHLKHAAYHQHFFKDVREIEAWLNRKDELLNSTYSQSEFTLDEGEALLRGLGEVRDELNAQGELLSTLEKRAQNVVPLKQRRQPVARPMPVLAVCSYNQGAVRIEKGEQWILHDNSGRVKWRVSNGSTGSDCNVPGVVFLIPPPDREALDALERLRRQFERSLALWQRKQLRMRQNMIFATIRVVRGWDLTQFLAMGADQRNAIRKALNEDASKLLTEGDSSDPQLRRLRREMDDVNRLFDEFERRARAEEESKNAGRIFNEQATALITSLDEAERTLNTRLASPVPRDLDTLEHLVVQHKDFEQTLKSLAPDLETAQATFKSIARKTPAQQQRLDKLLAQWNHVWNCSHLYVERLKCVEMLLSSLDEANTVLSDFELRLASFGEMPSNLESLQRVHEELIRLQKDVSRQQPAVDQLIEDGANVRRVVDKSRSHLPPRAGPHPDMERLDTDLHRLTQRWNNICSQLMDRLRSCENAYSNLTKLANSYQTEVTFLDTSYNQLNSLSPIKSQAKEQIEPTKALFNSVVERTSVIETVNIDGGRFIREAKIYNRSLQRYREWLVEDVHPSLDASPTANATSGSGGEADVARDLDILNHRFQALLSILQDRMKKLAEMNPHNSEFQEFASSIGPKPLRTFRTEFNIYESAGNSAADPLGVSVKHSSQTRISTSDLTDPGGTPVEGNVTKSVASVRVTRGSSKEKIVRSVESDSTNTMGANTSKTNGETNVGTTMRFSEIRSLRRVQRVEEGIGTDAMLDMPGIVHPQTGELLTVGDAVRLRILDVRSGRINTVVEAKPVALTIKEAVAKGLVDAGLADRLLGPSGITVGTEDAPDGSREQISLLEAIQRELYDAERGPHERVKVRIANKEGVTIKEAVKAGVLDVFTGHFKSDSESNKVLELTEAFSSGKLVTKKSLPVEGKKSRGLSLSDAVDLGIVDNKTGFIVDRNDGSKHDLEQAVELGLLDPNVCEVVDVIEDDKITLTEAIQSRIIDDNNYQHRLSSESLPLQEARRRQLIIRPMTLKDAVDMEIYDDGRIRTPTHRAKVPILESISRSVLDSDNIKCVVKSSSQELLTLSEAMSEGIIRPEGIYVDNVSGRSFSIPEAVEKGLITSVSVKSIFDIDCFKDTNSNRFLSLNKAFETGVLNGQGQFVDTESGKIVAFEDAVKQDLIRPEVLDMLNRKIGMKSRSGRELTVFDAVMKNLIDPNTGNILERRTRRIVALEDAIKRGIITVEGASLLKSLLSITLTTQTVTKTVNRYSTKISVIPEPQIIDNSEDERMLETSKRKSSSPLKDTLKKALDSLASRSPSPKKIHRDDNKESFESNKEIPISAEDKHVFELPPNGWFLSEAIENKLFDPVTGLFIIPGTDRLVSFEECVKLEIINPKSALVVEPNHNRNVSLKRALEKQVLDATGHYTTSQGKKITMKEAIAKNLIILELVMQEDQDSSRLIQVTRVPGGPDLVEIGDVGTSLFKQIRGSDHESTRPEPLRVSKDIIFDSSTALVINTDSNEAKDISEAIRNKEIEFDKILVKDPHTGKDMTLPEAIRQGIVDETTGCYKDAVGRSIGFADAAKFGVIAVIGAPLVAAGKAVEILKDSLKLDSSKTEDVNAKRGETHERGSEPTSSSPIKMDRHELTSKTETADQRPMSPTYDEVFNESPVLSAGELTRGRVTTEPKYKVSIGRAQSLSQSPEREGKPVILQKMRRKVLKPCEAVQEGLIDEATADILEKFIVPEGESFKEAVETKIIDGDTGAIRDPQRGDLLTIKEALDRGLIDSSGLSGSNNLLIPLARSLSVPAVLEQGLYENGKIVHPETGAHLNLKEAITCDIVDPLSRIIEPGSGNELTLQEAINKGTVNDLTSRVKTRKGSLDLLTAVRIGDFFEEFEASSNIPPAGMTFPVALKRGLIDPKSKDIIHPITGYRKPIGVAIDDNFIMSLPGPISPDSISVNDALTLNLIDSENGVLIHPKTKDKIPISEAVKTGLLVLKPQDHANAKNATIVTETVTKKIVEIEPGYEVKGGAVINLETGEEVSVDEAVKMGIVKTAKNVTIVTETVTKKIIEVEPGYGIEGENVINLETGEELSVDEAVKRGIVKDSTPEEFKSDKDAVVEPKSSMTEIGFSKNTSKSTSPEQGLGSEETYYSPDTKKFKDLNNQKTIPTLEQFNTNKIVDPRVDDTLSDETCRKFIAAEKRVGDEKVSESKHPKSTSDLNVKDAAKLGLLAVVGAPVLAGKAVIDVVKGLGKGKPSEKVEIPPNELSLNLRLNPVSENELNRSYASREKMLTDQGLRREFIEPESIMVKIDGKLLTFEHAVEDGLIDIGSGVIKCNNAKIKFEEALERGIMIKVKRPIPIVDALEKGIYDEESGFFLDPATGDMLSLQEAIETNLIDPESVRVRDTKNPASQKTLSLKEAIDKGLVDSDSGKVFDFTSPKVVQLSLREAMDNGILKIKKPSSDREEEKVMVPKDLKECKLAEAIMNQIIDPGIAVVKNPRTGGFNLLKEGIKDGFIDVQKNVVFETKTLKIDPLMVSFDNGAYTIFLREPLKFDSAVADKCLDLKTGKFESPYSKGVINLDEAIISGLIDPESVLIKDTAKLKLLKLPEAIRKGVMDSAKFNVVDTATSKLSSLSTSLDNGLITTQDLSLIESLDYGLYNPTSGTFTDPFCSAGGVVGRRRLTLSEAIQQRLVDASTTVIKDPATGDICSLNSAISSGLLDANIGRMNETNTGKLLDLLRAKQRGYILPAETRQAMEEKYKLCEEVLSQLLAWISEVEDRLANQDVAQENTEHLRNQINILKLLKEELDSQQRSVANCLDQVRVIVTTGGEYLSREEVASLERNGKSLRTRYDRATDRTERLLRRLIAAGEELSKFKSELTVFSNWLEQAKRSLDEREHSLGSLNRTDASGEHTREFVSDVIAHQADLRFITMAAQKFVDESKEYLTCLNEFRTSLPARLPHIEPISAHDSAVRNNVVTVTAQYKDLLNRANALADKLSGVGGCQRDYRDALDKARSWMRDAEIRANKLLSEPFAADPHSLQDQLGRAKTLNNEFVAQARLIDNLKGALENLVRAVEGQVSGAEIAALREPVYDLESKYSQLSDALAERCKLLDTALVQSQGVQDALDSLLAWLSSAESRLKDALRPVSLNKERLEDRLREYRVLQSDIDTHRPSVDSVTASAQELVATASNPRLAKKIETKLKDVISRMSKVQERCLKLGDQLSEIQLCLTQFSTNASQLQRWLSEATETAQETSGAGIDELIAQRDARRDKFESTVREGKALVNRNDVTDTGAIRDQVKAIETQWKELNQLLDEKLRLGKARTEQQLAYERLRDQVHVWLSTMETRVGRLEPVAVDVETVKRQAEELKPLLKDHREYASTIDKVNELGQALDALTRPASESPTRRRSSVSPVKRMSQVTRDSQSARRQSQDIGGSPSPTKVTSFSLQSPLSPGGSSGFGSRRSSPDNFHLEEMTPVQHELNEVNNRYSLLGVRLSDRQSEIDSLKDELRKHADHLRQLSQFLDKVQRTLPKETIAQTKDEAEKTCRAARAIQEEMYEKQALLESTRAGVSDLLRRKGSVAGADRLHDELQEVVSRWRSLQDACKNRIAMMEGLKDFYDTHDNLSSWLASKDRMITVLGPISSDSRMVQSQVQQVQVLREEFRTQQPQLQHLSDVAADVLSRVPADTPDAAKINNKLRAVQDRWNDLSARLDARLASLGAAADTTREFDAALTRLRDTLQAISDQLDDVPTDREPEEQLRKVQMLERQLEGARPLLADLESAGADLCAVLSDAASRADIQAKLSAVDRQYSALQKKLDLRKAEIENTLRDGRQFEATCAKMLGWLSEQVAALNERLLVSADRDILQQQVDAHEPIYKEVLQKEHEVIMLLNKGQELISRAANMNAQRTDTRSLQRDVDKIQQVWERLRKDASERHNRLQTCMEHCRKYYRANDAFAPWLAQAEARLDSLRPDSFKRRDVDRQLRELSAFRNEVWKRSGEFENLRSHGETFVAACDVDKEVVKQELATVKTRWDKLNNELLEKNQWLEEMSRRLADFTDQLRDLNHSVQRCEDRLASHDAIATAARDPKALERIKSLREETNALRKPLAALKKAADDLVSEAAEVGVSDASHLRDEVDAIGERLDDLQGRLDDRCSRLQSAATAVSQFNDLVKTLVVDLNSLESELDAMKPPGRDVKTVRSQQDDLARLVAKISRASDEVNRAVNAGEHLVDSGFALDTAGTRDQVESLSRQLGRLEERTRAREEELADVLDKLQDFYKEHSRVVDNITQAGEDLRRLRPVGSEVDAIKCQQDEFASFRRSTVEPLSQAVDNVNRNGQGLIRSAAGGVNTNILEKDLEKMNDKWNALKDKLNERDRRLDVGLLQSGKFQEALEGFAKWLSDTEEMVANQKPPSADYKVVKAQLQEQKFLKKMLADRQNSMSSLFAMGNEVAADADMQERKAIERQLKELMSRFEKLCEGAAQRYDALMEAMAVAKDFQDKLVPVTEWLDRAEKKVKDMELVPTDEEKIQQRIREHDALHDEILRKKTDLSELTEVGSNLMALVGEEEASATADKIQDAADRYATLVDRSDALGQLLEASRAGLRHLVLTYQDLQAWMESMEASLNRYKVLAVHTDKLLMQMDDLADLTEEVSNHQNEVDATVDSGLELMKHISSDEAIQLKDKLDSLQRRYNDLTSRCSDMLKHAQDALPLVQQFHNAHNSLVDWMLGAEAQLQVAEPSEDDIRRLEQDVQEFRPVLETINLVGPQLCQISPGEGAATIEGLVTRDNRRFDAIAEQVQRKAMRLQLSKQRSLEVIGDIDDLLDWFREVETQLREAEPPSSEPDVVRLQLKEHKALNDDISGQKGRVRDVLSTAKKVLRESTQHNDDTSAIRERTEDLRETMETVSGLSSDRLGALEQALALAEHFGETHTGLASWLDDTERHVAMLALPALRPDLIAAQQDKHELLVHAVNEQRPLVDKLNKTGEALIKLCGEDDGAKVQDALDSDNARYAALKAEIRQRQLALEKALQESSQFSDKLEGMLRALAQTADQVSSAEPISAHPPRIRSQLDENAALVEDLGRREEAFQAVRRAANDVINKAPTADPAVKDIRRKLERLNSLWNEVQSATSDRSRSLEDALAIAERFWDELQSVMATLRDLEDSLTAQEPPAVRPQAIQRQQSALQEIKSEMDHAKPEVEACRQTGQSLMRVCGEPDKPEVRKHMEDLDSAWDNVTALFAKREENLIHAMEKAMEFHETLQELLDFLDKAEDKFSKLGPLGADIDAVKKQINQLKSFKSEVDPHMVKVEALNRQAQELTERTSAEQAAALREPLARVNQRWDELLRGVVERQRQLENALLRLGQFQHALAELMAWIDGTERTLDRELKVAPGDPQLLEVELAKLKVLVNDIQAHQSSVDTLNDAGRQIIEQGKGTDEASSTHDKLTTLNRRWRELLQKAADRQGELEEALRDAHRFSAELQDLLSWLGEVDGIIAASKPVGGLPETASEQLERFMEIYNELEENRPKVETVLQQGTDYLSKAQPGAASNLATNVRTLKQRWESVTARANDKKIKLEIALKEATEFHDALQAFVDWLTSAEKTLAGLKPVSRVLATILEQIEEHKAFQKEVGVHRETMLHLDKKGTHLKYFSQKQDVILIKNLLISVQHRWERVVSKSAERTRALDHGYKEARDFHDAYSNLMNWLNDTEHSLDELEKEASSIGNDPDRIKARLAKHRELQRALSGKQATYDATMRAGKSLKEKAPKSDEPALRQMMNDLKEKWNTVCAKSVDRQRKLEEALLYCGQFKDALEALADWLKKVERELSEDTLVHGDLDTVTALVDQHKALREELTSRSAQMESVRTTADELARKASPADAQTLRNQVGELNSLWTRTNRLAERKSQRLEEALKVAETLHKRVHMLLEWLSDAEMKLRFVNSLPDDDQETRNQLAEHAKFMREMMEKEVEKDATITLAQQILAKAHPDAVSVIKHWITIIQARWDEVSTWAKQREQRLDEHLRSLQDLDALLEELLAWLAGLENTLMTLEAEPLPEDIPTIEGLIRDHHEFMENTARRQGEVDSVIKARTQQPPPAPSASSTPRKTSAKRLSAASKDELTDSTSDLHDTARKNSLKASRENLLERRGSRSSPTRELRPAEGLPHIGPRFPPKGSKGSEPVFRSPRCRLLWDRWRGVWLLAWQRQRRLQERLNYLQELERVKNFSWDQWRKKFLKFMNHKKSRLTDLFRKMDKNNDGLIPREDFVDGIIRTKFDTSRLEMSAVADMFDHNGEAFIDWKEFIAALRPDWEERSPTTEAEKIHDEVKRLVMLCTCRQKFRVFQVGEGKYRFGDSQKLRLVRILRSTVMVRVGGGWVALDEFLVKNDPCRAKGRTNVELREQFILADGVSQSMSAFKPKASPGSQRSLSLSSGAQGPITKVRERSARSVPMGKTVTGRTGTPDSLSDTEGSPLYARTPVRKASSSARRSSATPGGSLPGSRPASRQGSKPPSRHGSNLSLASSDDGTPSRIPRRSVPASRSSGTTTPTARKLTAPTINGRTRSPSTTPVTKSSMHRASSIPTLSGYNSSRSSRIPVFVGSPQSPIAPPPHSASASSGWMSGIPTTPSSNIPRLIRTRTPSGSSTPVPAGLGATASSKLVRRPSAAADSAASSARKSSSSSATGKATTPDSKPAPFRL